MTKIRDDKPGAGTRVRREAISAQQAVDKIVDYLEKQLEITNLDKKRYREKELVAYLEAVRKSHWLESMIIWIEHNV